MTLKDFAESKGFTDEQLGDFGLSNGAGAVVIPYYDLQGNLWPKTRLRASNEAGRGFSWQGDGPVIPYGLHRPIPYNPAKALFVVEGESDCWALWSSSIAALGIPGATSTACLLREHVEPMRMVLVVEEPDSAGKRFPHRVAQRLYDQGYAGKVYAVTLDGFKDAREAFAAGVLQATLKAAWATKREIEKPERPQPVGITLVSTASIFDEPEVDMDWVIEGLLAKSGCMFFVSLAGVGKTVFARSMALAVSRGDPFVDRATTAGRVMYLAFEGTDQYHKAAIRSLCSPNDNIDWHFGLPPEVDAVAWLRRQIEATHPALVVFDTWQKFGNEVDIEKYGLMNRLNRPLKALRDEFGCAMVWIHHAPWGSPERPLGSQALAAEADVILVETRSPEGLRAVKTTKIRFGTELEETVVRMDENGRITSAGSKYVYQVNKAKVDILAALTSEGLTTTEVVDAVEARRATTLAALKILVRDGAVKILGDGKRGSPKRYVCVRELQSDEGSESLNSSTAPSRGVAEPNRVLADFVPIRREPIGPSGTIGTSGTTGTSGTAGTEDDLLSYSEEVIR